MIFIIYAYSTALVSATMYSILYNIYKVYEKKKAPFFLGRKKMIKKNWVMQFLSVFIVSDMVIEFKGKIYIFFSFRYKILNTYKSDTILNLVVFLENVQMWQAT